jgi:hypothetical protein
MSLDMLKCQYDASRHLGAFYTLDVPLLGVGLESVESAEVSASDYNKTTCRSSTITCRRQDRSTYFVERKLVQRCFGDQPCDEPCYYRLNRGAVRMSRFERVIFLSYLGAARVDE